MNRLTIPATKYTPLIDFDPQSRNLVIQGESYPENTAEFYAPIISWIKDNLSLLASEPTTVNMEIIYFNSSSSKVLMDIFELFEDQAKAGKRIKVNWIFDADNESAQEYGEEFQEDLEHLEFNLVEKKTP